MSLLQGLFISYRGGAQRQEILAAMVALLLLVSHVVPTSVVAAEGDSGDAPYGAGSPYVTVAPVQVPIHYITSGTVTSDHRVAVGSRLSGYIHDLTLREGDRVASKQLLFRVDPVDVRQRLAQSQAELADAKSDLQRFRILLKNRAISRQQFDKVKLRFAVATSKVKQARNQLKYAVVRSPLDGVIVEKRQHNGDLASPGSVVLMIENTTEMAVDTRVSDQFVARIHVGDHPLVRMREIPYPLRATVRQVVPAADSRSHQFLVKLTLPSGSPGRPGSLVEVLFTTGSREVLALPVSTVVHRHGLDGIYIVDNQGVVHWRLVRLAAALADGMVEIAAGVAAEMRVVDHPAVTLRSGDSVDGVKR
ncbi:MAG: efflux RND transporter periplasmic adaptor subunit [Mariprofundales bacterium]|nr:efflux RND transporter periplasmic adaptor subunit [Mariprofundales bacterium]